MRLRKLYRPSERVIATPPEEKKVMKVHDTGVSEEILDVLSEAFEYLYDPDNMDHLPIDKKLSVFAKRDLYKTKFYHSAVKYFGKQRSIMEMLGATKGRKRMIVASPMTQNRDPGIDDEYEQIYYNTPMPIRPSLPLASGLKSMEESDLESKAKLRRFRESLHKRQAIQRDINSMGDIDKWLSGKPDKSALEKRAYKDILKSKQGHKFPDLVYDKPIKARPSKELPTIDRPTPIALTVIQQELAKRKLRLVDLFTDADKNKDWSLSREELRKTFSQAGIDIQDEFLEDLMVTLDRDNTNRLYYSDLAVAMKDLIVEQRSASSASNTTNLSDVISLNSRESSPTSKAKDLPGAGSAKSNLSIPAADLKKEAADSPTHIEYSVSRKNFPRSRKTTPANSTAIGETPAVVPEVVRPKKGRTLTGYAPFDNHTAPSQLTGEHAAKIDNYRQRMLQEYMKIMKLCQQNNVVLDEKLFEKGTARWIETMMFYEQGKMIDRRSSLISQSDRVLGLKLADAILLHPADKPAKKIRRSIRQPGAKSEFDREKFYKRPPVGSPTAGHSSALAADSSHTVSMAGLKSTNLLALLGGKLAFQQGGGAPAFVSQEASTGLDDRFDDGTSTHGSSSVAAVYDKRTIDGGKYGVNLHQVGPTLPHNEDFEVDDDDDEFRVHLSTGWATVKRKVDCWLTFEEFLRLTSKIDSKFDHSHIGRVDPNAFWPGALLHKFRLYMDSHKSPKATGKGAVFQEIKSSIRAKTSLGPVHKRH